MHIPDGYLGPQTYMVLDVVMIPIWAVAASKVKKSLKARQIPLMALAAGFAFIIMMFNVPVIGGSTGHAVGATLIAILLGPWAATISVSIALTIQALLFGDGGITALGANCFNMAVVMPFVGYYLYRLVVGKSGKINRKIAASGVASYVAIVVAAIVAGVEFGIQPLIAHTASGAPLYAPYPLKVAVTAMFTEHLLFFGPVEAIVTMGVVAALAKQESALLAMKPASKSLRWVWAGFAALVLLTPIGVLAQGTAWGEWGVNQFASQLKLSVPVGLEKLSAFWTAAIPAYAPAFIRNPFVGYLFSAIVGASLCIVVVWGMGKLISSRKIDDDEQ
ncbi:MAG: cobalt transporter CbiM [Coriobacteriia bacterium]|nr:cobalt transporter CbiM [Coriobacteriia bacterium]